ncbi:MAG TPA: ribosome maturation factor RimM, partial [Polyangia bacterium]
PAEDGSLIVGFVARAHGVRGVVRLRVSADLAAVDAVWLDDERFAVRHASRDKDEWLVTLEGVGDRDAADALRGRTVRISRADVAVADDELLVADLVGCTVVDVTGAVIGEVTGSFHSGAHEVLELRADDERGAREILLPLVDAFVVSIDVAARRIVYDPPEGLLDLGRKP